MRAAQTLKSEGSFAGLASLVPYRDQRPRHRSSRAPGPRTVGDGRRERRSMAEFSLGRTAMILGPRLKVRSSAGFAFLDQSMMSGADRRVSIRTT